MTGTGTVTRVRIPAGSRPLDGELTIPEKAQGLVILAWDRDQCVGPPDRDLVVHGLHDCEIATLVFDCLGFIEDTLDAGRHPHIANVELLSQRLVAASLWAGRNRETSAMPVGYLGAGIGSAVALLAAMTRPRLVRAIVSGGGRPQMAGTALRRVEAATLLVVAGRDLSAVRANADMLEHLEGARKMAVVPGASRRFVEPGAVEAVARLATEWFCFYFTHGSSDSGKYLRPRTGEVKIATG